MEDKNRFAEDLRELEEYADESAREANEHFEDTHIPVKGEDHPDHEHHNRYADEQHELEEYADESFREANEHFNDTNIRERDVQPVPADQRAEGRYEEHEVAREDVVVVGEEDYRRSSVMETPDDELNEPYAGTRETDQTKIVKDDPILGDMVPEEDPILEDVLPQDEMPMEEDPVLRDNVYRPGNPLNDNVVSPGEAPLDPDHELDPEAVVDRPMEPDYDLVDEDPILGDKVINPEDPTRK